MRRLAASLGLFTLLSASPSSAEIVAARYADPTTRYAHGVLGDAIEYGTLELTLDDGRTLRLILPESRVFEDTAPRLADVDGDGHPEVVVVETDSARGARLAIYGETGLQLATPFIGTRFRWLAPAAIADLDGDGAVELAYVEKPHLAKTLRVWRVSPAGFRPVATLAGVSNHRIGDPEISGGLRECGNGPEMIVASGDWTSVMAVTLANDALTARRLGDLVDADSFAAAMDCKM
ncbi:VCBS repeat-containing protein [Pseudoruegeria sp. SK021]|uniref:FG-GAP repeat domain-containing protein n=1 Tax=Pseudoruegeria sp. SK021 TaxID=1933035 RepID=UPI000A239B0B|nr:VCBS repeat-containing protein [Pseudoruegeria sp. SK021]OSP56693.1 hypothetical protein BV911_01705 [Pseudoruegeria sp. SK021]